MQPLNNITTICTNSQLRLKWPTKYIFHRCFFLVSIVCFSGCSTLLIEEDSKEIFFDATETEKQLKALKNWSLFGKLGIRTSDESVTVAINNWQQTGENFEVNISSTFFGLGSTKLYGNTDFLSIFQSGEEPISSFEPNALIETTLGFPLPISHLQYWVKGLPVEGIQFSRTFNQQGLIKSLAQDNWSLSYSNYHTEYSVPLPGKIKIQRDNIRIIVAVKEWTLP